MSSPDEFYSARRVLGKTGLLVSRIGIGCSYGVSASDLLKAFDRGINYYYFGTLRRSAMAHAVRDLTPAHRNELVVAIQSYSRWPGILRRSVHAALKKLQLNSADLLILGKVDQSPSNQLVEEACRLREAGVTRFLAISAHRRSMFEQYIREGIFDVVMVRYNAAHPGAETEVFPFLSVQNRPGVICYTATRWGSLLQPVNGERPASASDCYRFVLRQPCVDLCLSGPKNGHEMQEALRVLESTPLSDEEIAWMRRIGSAVRNKQAHNFILRKLIFD